MCSLKPNKPVCFEGKRDEYAVKTWLYQVKQYLALVQIGNANELNDATKISFAASFLTGTAAAWWYTVVGANSVPGTWDEFEKLFMHEFVPLDSSRRSRDKLRRLYQKTSVTSYLSEFRNVTLTIPDMSEGEKVDRFCQGLKPQVRLEVMKTGPQSMNDAARIALNIDSAIFGARAHGNFNYGIESRPTPMEIGNTEQSRRDRANDACFKCHKPGCRPWKCGSTQSKGYASRKPQAKISNVENDQHRFVEESEN